MTYQHKRTKEVVTGVFLQENGKVLSTDSYKAYLYNPSDLPVEKKIKIKGEI